MEAIKQDITEEKVGNDDYLSTITSLAFRNPNKEKFQEFSKLKPDFSGIETKLLDKIKPLLNDNSNNNDTTNATYKIEYIMNLFNEWYNLALESTPFIINPNAVCLSTIHRIKSNDSKSDTFDIIPDSRYVLCKQINDKCGDFIFYTNYTSNKSQQIQRNQNVSLLFYWDCLSTQVRIQGTVILLPSMLNENNNNNNNNGSKEEQERLLLLSENYWHSRPFKSKISALTSDQSSVVANKTLLEAKYEEIESKYIANNDKNQTKEELNKIEVKRPPHWGAFVVRAHRIEFWKGHSARFHDRVVFEKASNQNNANKENQLESSILLEKSDAVWTLQILQP